MEYGSTVPNSTSGGFEKYHEIDDDSGGSSPSGGGKRPGPGPGSGSNGNSGTNAGFKIGKLLAMSENSGKGNVTFDSSSGCPMNMDDERSRLLRCDESSKSVRRTRHTCVVICALVAGLFLVFILYLRLRPSERLIPLRHVQEDQGYFDLSSDNDQQSPVSVDDRTFEYIVVGAGPSGIIAATKLARRLLEENPSSPARVLLLESGTTSQSSVTKSLNDHFRKLKHSGSQGQGSTGLIWEEGTGSRLNKYDIPLMWSGVASSQGRLRQVDLVTGQNRRIWSNHHWPIRKTLLARAVGGCGVHNAMIYLRSLPTDMQRWNLSTWDFYTVLREYRDLETYDDENWEEPAFWRDSNATALRDMPWRGRNGPMRTVPSGPEIDLIAPLFVESCISSGIGLATQGFNSPNPAERVGAGYYEFNIRNGLRESVAETFLGGLNDFDNEDKFNNNDFFTGDDNDDDKTDANPGQRRTEDTLESDDQDATGIPSNLEIRVGATVTRVLTDDSGGRPRAIGVEYINGEEGTTQVMLREHDNKSPNAEVVMASGAILTPQLLFNSGIGPNGTVAKVPGVGKNLQDHPVVALSFRLLWNITELTPSIYTIGDDVEDYFSAVSQLEMMDKSGLLPNLTKPVRESLHARVGTLGTAGFSAGAFLRSPWVANGDDSPDIQLTVFPRVVEPHVTRKEQNGNKPKVSAMLVTIALLRPEGRYEVKSADTNLRTSRTGIKPADDNPMTKNLHFSLPYIDLPSDRAEYLTDTDVERLVWGINEVRKIHNSPPLSYNTAEETSPGIGEPLDRFVRQSNLPNSHWVGSVKMGKDDDPMAVLDEDLRVRAVDSLRVVDGSAIPVIANGNTHSMITVVASQGAQRIIRDRIKTMDENRLRGRNNGD